MNFRIRCLVLIKFEEHENRIQVFWKIEFIRKKVGTILKIIESKKWFEKTVERLGFRITISSFFIFAAIILRFKIICSLFQMCLWQLESIQYLNSKNLSKFLFVPEISFRSGVKNLMTIMKILMIAKSCRLRLNILEKLWSY